jgi:cytochrome c biogenesis protein CcmG/thiol:disulfide interchange protein DsbE
MKRWVTWAPMLVALPLILFLGWRFSAEPATQNGHVGGSIPVFSLPDLYQNEQITEAYIKGDWAIVNIWATWCSPCLKEHGVLMDISKRYDIPLIGIDFKDDTEAAKQWLAEKGNPYALVILDEQGRSAFDWGVVGVPETLLVDPQGIIRQRFAGELTLDVWEKEFAPLLLQEGVK